MPTLPPSMRLPPTRAPVPDRRIAMTNPPPEHEFDAFIEDYRKNQDGHVRMSGESGAFFAEYKVQKLVSWFPEYSVSPVSVLDFGCGDGLMTSFIRQYLPAATVSGVDPSSKSIDYARRHHEGIRFEWFDGTKTPLPDASVDLVTAAGVFHHVDLAAHADLVSEVRRLLRPGGRFIIFELNPFNPLTVLTFKLSPVDRNANLVFPSRARRLLRGMGPVGVRYYCFFPAALAGLRVLEPYMMWCPLGALYAAIVSKSDRDDA